jgi:hypothetical protein
MPYPPYCLPQVFRHDALIDVFKIKIPVSHGLFVVIPISWSIAWIGHCGTPLLSILVSVFRVAGPFVLKKRMGRFGDGVIGYCPRRARFFYITQYVFSQ